tara:strand:- start:63 stop:2006 length:1944 start_codon:yes stop_codon:yes gene_type:complete
MKKYQIAVTSADKWGEIHEALTLDSNQDGIPDRRVDCADDKVHSPTRGVYELTDEEANDLKGHVDVLYVELDPESNPDAYPQPEPDIKRWGKDVKVYRDLGSANAPTNSGVTTAGELNRTHWGMPRTGLRDKSNFGDWGNSNWYGNPPVTTGDISYSLTGKGVDIIIQDSGILQNHPELRDYDGVSRVRDIILDGPYYIDKAYWDSRLFLLYTRADGRVGPTTASAHDWWENNDTAHRSAIFASGGANDFGTISIPSNYTVANTMGEGSDGQNLTSSHGTACASQAAGLNYGLAWEADIWNISGISSPSGASISTNYDVCKVFHKYKPYTNSQGIKKPTVMNGSWGYGSDVQTGTQTINYRFAGVTGVTTGNAASSTLVDGAINGIYNARFASSSGSNSVNTAGEEMIAEGVIYVTSAGNSNQRMGVATTDPHYLDYLQSANGFDHEDGTLFDGFNNKPFGSRQFIHPSNIGFSSSHPDRFFPNICVGAMDEYRDPTTGAERKANYSNNGPGVDVWAPADETLAAGIDGANGSASTYTNATDNNYVDRYFNGTSSASPVCAGLIALYMQSNPGAGITEVKGWLHDHGSVIDSTYRDDSTNPSLISYWSGSYNMRDAEKRILYNPFANDTRPTLSGIQISGNVTIRTE